MPGLILFLVSYRGLCALEFHGFRSLLRQTVILGKKDDKIWGICSFNIPLVKPVNGTPTIVFSGSLKKNVTARTMYNYVNAIRSLAQKHGKTWYEITNNTKLQDIKFDVGLK